MSKYKMIMIWILALAGMGLTCTQLIVHLTGSALCFNQGCQVVEEFLSLSPYVVNGMGACFFLAILLLSFFAKDKKDKKESRHIHILFSFIILAAFVSEGIFLGIQLFIAHTFCSYCITIALLVGLIAILYDLKLFAASALLCVLQLFWISNIEMPIGKDVNLNEGTYGVKTCSNPSSVAYLIFSQKCPHCKKVLENLKGCFKCEIHFNPISRIETEILPGVLPVESYRPEINLLALKIFGINSVPVLIQRTDNGFEIIKGDMEILKYISEHCFCSEGGELLQGLEPNNGLFGGTDDGLCSIQEECAE